MSTAANSTKHDTLRLRRIVPFARPAGNTPGLAQQRGLCTRYAADYQKWPSWFEGVSDFEATTSVTQGNGARYAYRARMMGVSATLETEVHDFQQNRGWRGVATRGMPHRTQWAFAPVAHGT
jgi:hypothetical protein